MNKAQKFLLDNSIGDIVLNKKEYPENTIENAQKWLYLSDILNKYEQHVRLEIMNEEIIPGCTICGEQNPEIKNCTICRLEH